MNRESLPQTVIKTFASIDRPYRHWTAVAFDAGISTPICDGEGSNEQQAVEAVKTQLRLMRPGLDVSLYVSVERQLEV